MCMHTYGHVYRRAYAYCMSMYVPVCIFAQLSAWLVSCMCGTGVPLCASVSLDIFSWCLAIPVM